MHKNCNCGGELERLAEQCNAEIISWRCAKCNKVYTQQKRKPSKLNADKDIVFIRKHLNKLKENNPITSDNIMEWTKLAQLIRIETGRIWLTDRQEK